jgi:hypothetical protein
MGRLSMRTAVAEYFATANLEYVGKVLKARPEVLTEQEYETSMFNEAAPSENGSSAVLVVNIPEDKRQRRADTGRGAVNDSWIFKIALEVFFASTGGEAVKAQEDYDTVIDGVIESIRANANLGSPNTVWSAGEYDNGIQHDQAQPFTDDDGVTIFIFGAVTFDSWQWLAGPV